MTFQDGDHRITLMELKTMANKYWYAGCEDGHEAETIDGFEFSEDWIVIGTTNHKLSAFHHVSTQSQLVQSLEWKYQLKLTNNFVLQFRFTNPTRYESSTKFISKQLSFYVIGVPYLPYPALSKALINCHNPTQQQLKLTRLRLDTITKPNPPTTNYLS